MAYRFGNRNDERGIDGSRMADYDYGFRSGFGKRHTFDVSEAYQEGHPWVYADHWLRLNPSLPGIGGPGSKDTEGKGATKELDNG